MRKQYYHRGLIKRILCRFSFLNTSYLFLCQLFVKTLYLLLALLQIVILNYWLRDHHNDSNNSNIFFGFYDWNLSDRFPRMTLCKIDVYIQMNDKQIHWLQCALPMNLFIEKIYVGIYVWLWFLILVITFGLLYTILKATPVYRKNFIKKRLNQTKRAYMDKIYDILSLDGVFTLDLISSNTNDVNVNAIVNEFVKDVEEEKNK